MHFILRECTCKILIIVFNLKSSMGKTTRQTDLLKAIEAERKQEEDFYLKIIANKTIKEKIDKGVAWHPVEINHKRYTVGEYVEVEVFRVNKEQGNHRIRTGAGVNIFINLHNEITTYSGVVSYLRKDKMRIILNDELLDKDDISVRGSIGVELVYDERPYKVMRKAIEALASPKEKHLQDLVNGIEKRLPFDYDLPVAPYSTIDHLNPSQNRAIEGCLKAERIGIIHGPPGTGKTTTIVGLVKKLLQSEKQILVCAPSNNAVDLLAMRLNDAGHNVLRIGNITRIDDDITHLTIEEKVRGSSDWNQVKKIKREAEDLSKKANKFKRSFGPSERKQRYELRKEAREARKWAKELEYRLTSHVVSQAEVILCTLVGASHSNLVDRNFKTCIIDEASQTLEPECWNVMLKAERTFLVGDHKQLPPTVKSKEALALGFDETLLDRMTAVIKHSYLLSMQYRMNEKILAFSNAQFYHNKLKSAERVQSQTLKDDGSPLIFIDTAGTGFEEEQKPGELSHFNSGEYFIVREHILSISERALGHSIGIITPYAEQVRHIRSAIEEEELLKTMDISIDSIDGFQGQEKDIIYLSLVRSNDRGEIGFLKDQRRLNVGLTRAKRKLVVIGDSSTIGSNKLYQDLIEHVEKTGTYKSAWEYMG